jgi:hypothetical protein
MSELFISAFISFITFPVGQKITYTQLVFGSISFKLFNFGQMFHQTRGRFSKKNDICPHVQLQTIVCLFYGGFGAVACSLLSGLSGYVDI